MKINSRYHPTTWAYAQWILFIVVLILLLLLTVGLKAQTPPSREIGMQAQYDRALIDKLANEYVSLKKNHGLIIGIIKNGQKEIFTYGETQKGNGIKPDKDAVFEIGQLSEVFTTSLLAVLEKEGKISSLETVQDVLKGVVKVPYYKRIICEPLPKIMVTPESTNPQTTVCFPDPYDIPQLMVLCDLATHSAGLPVEPFDGVWVGNNPYKDYTVEKLNKYIGSLPPNDAFGFQYNYSMVETALLGEALAVKMNKSYETLLNDKILGPLSMPHTFINLNDAQDKFLLNGHTQKGKLTNHRDYNALSPAMGIKSNVPDLLAFLAANLDTPTGLPTDEKSKLNAALAETHLPRIHTDVRNPDYMMGWGWIQSSLDERDSKNKKKMLWQVSEHGGFASYMVFSKSSGTAVVILSNSANAVDDLGHEILKSLETSVVPIKN